jgi:uncharacterized ferritin-like protein (DUF455 family)
MTPSSTLQDHAITALLSRNCDEKAALTLQLQHQVQSGEITLANDPPPPPPLTAGQPERPILVRPRELPQRKLDSSEGRAILFHALCHIEFNAINLALDALARFPEMPPQFYYDWSGVASEEASHFLMLRDHLRQLGYDYGDFPAHNGLWEMAQKTAHDVMIRMALVPRCLEARGLDVTPSIQQRLIKAGDHQGAAHLDIILRDEIGHVAIGNYWYLQQCQLRNIDPLTTFQQLINDYMGVPLRPPFHLEARRAAGFSETELAWLEGIG